MPLIDKEKVVSEIERLRKEDGNPYFPSETADKYYARGVHFTCDGLVDFLNTLEVKEADLEKEIETLDSLLYDLDGVAVKGTSSYLTVEDVKDIAKRFFELGLKARKGE